MGQTPRQLRCSVRCVGARAGCPLGRLVSGRLVGLFSRALGDQVLHRQNVLAQTACFAGQLRETRAVARKPSCHRLGPSSSLPRPPGNLSIEGTTQWSPLQQSVLCRLALHSCSGVAQALTPPRAPFGASCREERRRCIAVLRVPEFGPERPKRCRAGPRCVWRRLALTALPHTAQHRTAVLGLASNADRLSTGNAARVRGTWADAAASRRDGDCTASAGFRGLLRCCGRRRPPCRAAWWT